MTLPESASLILITRPQGAEVYIDGNKIDGKTPLTDVRVRGGESHKVEFHLAGYKVRWESKYVEPGQRPTPARSPPAGARPRARAPSAAAAVF